ncbi:hypothetical protein M9Y10_039396 [Tritrichomonas musculus]|uniref:Protein kinase domain-containing protein n=1 Tax=Tritrichomonas musculus TaxID=1915356 RepID=A0ABR2KB31_9EUKA
MSKTFELQNNLRVEINHNDLTAKVITSPKVSGTVIVPRYAINEEKKIFKIISIGDSAFENAKFDSLLFPEDSEVESFEGSTFFHSEFEKLQFPPKLQKISKRWCSCAKYLKYIEISPKNKFFPVIDNTFIATKSDTSSKDFDVLVFCLRDAKYFRIPSYIKEIRPNAIEYCSKLKSITFDPKSSLETLPSSSIKYNNVLESIVIAPSVKYVESSNISSNYKLKFVEFLSDYIKFNYNCFQCCNDDLVISFPNAKKIEFSEGAMKNLGKRAKLKIREGAELVGDGLPQIQSRIIFIEATKISSEKIEKKSVTMSVKKKEEELSDKEKRGEEESRYKRCLKHIQFLESRLRRYEDVVPFDPNSKSYDDEERSNYDDEEKEKKNENQNIFIDDEDESHHRFISKIGEGATSTTYKVINELTGEELCKKVLKAEEGKTTFKDVQNIYKEFEVLVRMSHPSICKCIGMNPQEKLNNNEDDKKDNSDDEEIAIKSKFSPKTESKPNTTIAIFLKYHPMNLRECLERDILNNTLKAKLVVEIAFGMLHIHEHGMIHRDLKLENVMINYIFEAQLIDFGLVHVDEMKNTMESMTKGVGTFAYMSPEMSKEEDYDNKTDVYSFGVLLWVLFTRRFPKQSLKEKLNNKPLTFPQPSSSISSFCIELIKKCMLFEAKKRPSFAEIVEEMFEQSFKLAEGVDSEIVLHRFRTLNRFRSLNKRTDISAEISPSKRPKKSSKLKFKPNIKPV